MPFVKCRNGCYDLEFKYLGKTVILDNIILCFGVSV